MPVFAKAQKRSLRSQAKQSKALAAEQMDIDDSSADVGAGTAAPEVGTSSVPQSSDDNGSSTVVQFNEPAQWVERMALTAVKPLPKDLAPDDDPKREEVFVQHTLLSVVKGLEMLEAAGVPWKRPQDYYAEMLKDDVHMNKIRESILKSKQQVEERAHRRAMKDQKKFGKEVQAEVLRQRAKYKRDMNEKISDWKRKRRGNNESIDDVLDDEEDQGAGQGRDSKRSRTEGRGGGGRGKNHARPKNLTPGGGSRKRPGKNSRRRRQ